MRTSEEHRREMEQILDLAARTHVAVCRLRLDVPLESYVRRRLLAVQHELSSLHHDVSFLRHQLAQRGYGDRADLTE